MSSKESSYEHDEEGNPKVTGYKVKRLRWETEKLKKMKKKLDKTYKKKLTQRAKDRILQRVDASHIYKKIFYILFCEHDVDMI